MSRTNQFCSESYFGQVNSENKKHGIGRECWVSGQIYEGEFKNGKADGWGREIDYNFYYEGMYKRGERCGGKRVWNTGREDQGC